MDVPSSVTFYADVVTQGNESREGLASSAFGQSKVASQSEVDLRIVGLESKQVKGAILALVDEVLVDGFSAPSVGDGPALEHVSWALGIFNLNSAVRVY